MMTLTNAVFDKAFAGYSLFLSIRVGGSGITFLGMLVLLLSVDRSMDAMKSQVQRIIRRHCKKN